MMALLLVLSIICLIKGTNGLSRQKDVIDNLNTLQIIRKYGYPAEAHEILTDDGYLLQMQRIPNGRNSNCSDLNDIKNNKPPVLLLHGLILSSATFLLLGRDDSLPLILADKGYDVWLGNLRGNTYSRAHVNLTADDNKFWNFTWHESGVYDIPAKIDFIRQHTNHDKVLLISYSMGSTAFFVLTSELPKYNDKILASFIMAPIVYLKNMRSPFFRLVIPTGIYKIFTTADESFLQGELLSESPIIKQFQTTFCEPFKIQRTICKHLLFLVLGNDSEMMTDETLERLLAHAPAGYSAKGFALYGQVRNSGKFGRYDYGPKKNLEIYGCKEPPQYKLENIRTPLYFYVGKNDVLATPPDLKKLKKRLKSLKSEFTIEYPKFTHLDFLVSKNAKSQVYDRLIEDMKSFLQNNNNN